MSYYTYLIGWSNFDRWYYGVRTANFLPPQEDLWHVYKTSSKLVHAMYEIHGEPDVIQVRKQFTNKKMAYKWETKVLKKLQVRQKRCWLNKAYGGGYIEIINVTPLPELTGTKREQRKTLMLYHRALEAERKENLRNQKKKTERSEPQPSAAQIEKRQKYLQEKEKWLQYKTAAAIKHNRNIPFKCRH